MSIRYQRSQSNCNVSYQFHDRAKLEKTSKTQNQTSAPPKKIAKDALLADIKAYPTDFLYERAKRFNCSATSIRRAMLRLGISQKNTIKTP